MSRDKGKRDVELRYCCHGLILTRIEWQKRPGSSQFLLSSLRPKLVIQWEFKGGSSWSVLGLMQATVSSPTTGSHVRESISFGQKAIPLLPASYLEQLVFSWVRSPYGLAVPCDVSWGKRWGGMVWPGRETKSSLWKNRLMWLCWKLNLIGGIVLKTEGMFELRVWVVIWPACWLDLISFCAIKGRFTSCWHLFYSLWQPYASRTFLEVALCALICKSVPCTLLKASFPGLLFSCFCEPRDQLCITNSADEASEAVLVTLLPSMYLHHRNRSPVLHRGQTRPLGLWKREPLARHSTSPLHHLTTEAWLCFLCKLQSGNLLPKMILVFCEENGSAFFIESAQRTSVCQLL